MIQHLFSLGGGLLGDAIAYLGVRVKNRAVVADLREAAQAADGGCGGKRLEVSVTDFGSKAGGPDLVEADVFIKGL